MADLQAIWNRTRGWYHYPPLKDPKAVKNFEGGACYDFRKRETLVDENFVKSLAKRAKLTEERCYEGVFGHEIGHYMVFPRNLATVFLAAKMIDDFFVKEGSETTNFIFQTYSDMATDTASVLEEQRTQAILDVREGLQATKEDPLNRNIRGVMLAYLKHQAQRPHQLDAELKPFLERMLTIDFLNLNAEKMRQGLFTFGEIVIDMVKKYGGKPEGFGPGDGDVRKALRNATPGEIKDALREISQKITRKEYEQIKEWLKENGVKTPKVHNKSIGTSEGDLPVDQEVIDYYKQLSMMYPLIVTKKLLDTDTTARSWSKTKKWRPGDDPNLALPGSSGGRLLPGVTRSIMIDERPVRTTDYKVPHLLLIGDSSGSMPDPKQSKSYAVLGGYCAARSYHLHGSSVGIINFSGSSFYLPYTRELDEALGAISAYQGGGTTVDVEMVRKMMGPEMADLYLRNPERDMRGLPREAVKKAITLNMGSIEAALSAESIDVIMLTDGGISNLNEVLELFREKAAINRATIILTHGYDQELADTDDERIAIRRIDDPKDIPLITIGETRKNFARLEGRI
jgi:hypothetical protein